MQPTSFVQRRRVSLRTLALTTALTVATAGLVAGAETASAGKQKRTLTNYIASGTAAGSQVQRNENVDSDSTAFSSLGCTRFMPKRQGNYVARVGTGNPFRLSEVRSSNWSSKNGARHTSHATNTISEGVLAAGRIRFEGLRAVARAFHTPDGYGTERISKLAALTIDAEQVEAPNRRQSIEIPGLGTLYLNYGSAKTSAKRATASVNVLRLEQIDGTVVRIGRATANLYGGATAGVFNGGAWASQVRALGDQAESQKGSWKPMPCQGTDGRNVAVTTAEAEQNEAGEVGARTSVVEGDQVRRTADGHNRSRVSYASLGGGRLQLYNIVGRVNVTRNADGSYEKNINGTDVGRIVFDGEELTPPPNGEPLELPGLGTITLGRTTERSNGLLVNGAHVVLFNGSEADTVVNLGNAKLYIKKG